MNPNRYPHLQPWTNQQVAAWNARIVGIGLRWNLVMAIRRCRRVFR